MSKQAPEAPLARLALVFHAPTIARVEVVYLPVAGRLVRAGLALLACWGLIPLVIWIPPHYPWPAIAFAAGIYLCFRYWTGRYVVRSFTGYCPRCGRPLELPQGTRIDLPHTLTCFGCHFDPVLEAAFPAHARPPSDAELSVEHRFGDCVGGWRLERRGDFATVVCDRCRARHCATPAAWEAAEAENRRTELLEELAGQGRFLL
jgi:hypothetical protein